MCKKDTAERCKNITEEFENITIRSKIVQNTISRTMSESIQCCQTVELALETLSMSHMSHKIWWINLPQFYSAHLKNETRKKCYKSSHTFVPQCGRKAL